MIIPYLVAMLFVIKVFMASGIFEDIKYGLTAAMQSAGLGEYTETLDLLPLVLTKPLTGSGARAVLLDLFDQHGPDSFLGLTASILMGSTRNDVLPSDGLLRRRADQEDSPHAGRLLVDRPGGDYARRFSWVICCTVAGEDAAASSEPPNRSLTGRGTVRMTSIIKPKALRSAATRSASSRRPGR